MKNNATKTWEIILFSLNGISSNTALFLIGYYMFYSQNLLGLSAVIVGFIATIMRIFDGITDPPIGILVDRTNTRFGKFRPYIILGCLITGSALIAIFNSPLNLGTTGSYIYTTFFYSIYVIGYTFQTTCTRAAQAILTKDPKQRPLFAVFNGGFNAILGGFLPLLLVTIMAPQYENQLLNPKLWSHISFIIFFIMLILSLLAAIGIASKDNPQNYKILNPNHKIGLKDMKEVIKKNKPLQMLIIAASTDKLASQLMNGVIIYIFSNCILNASLLGKFSSIKVWPVLIISMSSMLLARKFGLKIPFLVATWLGMISLIIMFIIGIKPDNYTLFLILFIFQQSMAGITINILNPMIADCTDFEEYRSGKFIPGIVGTIFTFVDKIISSFATTITGIALAFAGVSKGKILQNTYISDRFYWTMMFCFCIIPIIGYICSIISMKYYELTKEKMEEIQKELANKKVNLTSEELNIVEKEIMEY